jgi:hypothetical protein
MLINNYVKRLKFNDMIFKHILMIYDFMQVQDI